MYGPGKTTQMYGWAERLYRGPYLQKYCPYDPRLHATNCFDKVNDLTNAGDCLSVGFKKYYTDTLRMDGRTEDKK